MFRRLSKFLGTAVLVVLALLLAGFIYQEAATAIDAHRFPAPGNLVDVGGRRIHIRCQGTGQPSVILEAGLGGSSLDWSLVEPELAKNVRVCAYDRAGLGWSDVAPGPRTAEAIASDLHLLLEKAGEKGPYVLVAHSIGGLYARVFTARYPHEVRAVVLVDPTNDEPIPPQARTELDPAVVGQLDQMLHEAHAAMAKVARVMAYASRVGVPRSLVALHAMPESFGGIEGKLPSAVRAEYKAVSTTSRFYGTVYRESAATEAAIRQAKGAEFPAEMPLIILRPKATGTEEESGLPPEVINVLQRYEGIEPMMALSSRSRLVTIDKTGHYIHLDQPREVIEAVQQAVE